MGALNSVPPSLFTTISLVAGIALVALALTTRTARVQRLDDWVERHAGLRRVDLYWLASVCSLTGEKFVHPMLGALTTLAVLVARHGDPWRVVLPLAGASLGGITLHHLVKLVYRRRRPQFALQRNKTEAAFPSGHTTNATAVVATSAWILVGEAILPPGATMVSAIVVCLATGASRVALGWHWGTDVLGGWLAGIGIAALCCQAYEVLRNVS